MVHSLLPILAAGTIASVFAAPIPLATTVSDSLDQQQNAARGPPVLHEAPLTDARSIDANPVSGNFNVAFGGDSNRKDVSTEEEDIGVEIELGEESFEPNHHHHHHHHHHPHHEPVPEQDPLVEAVDSLSGSGILQDPEFLKVLSLENPELLKAVTDITGPTGAQPAGIPSPSIGMGMGMGNASPLGSLEAPLHPSMGANMDIPEAPVPPSMDINAIASISLPASSTGASMGSAEAPVHPSTGIDTSPSNPLPSSFSNGNSMGTGSSPPPPQPLGTTDHGAGNIVSSREVDESSPNPSIPGQTSTTQSVSPTPGSAKSLNLPHLRLGLAAGNFANIRPTLAVTSASSVPTTSDHIPAVDGTPSGLVTRSDKPPTPDEGQEAVSIASSSIQDHINRLKANQAAQNPAELPEQAAGASNLPTTNSQHTLPNLNAVLQDKHTSRRRRAPYPYGTDLD
ncbi:hypothetical protein GGU10DRAFT_373128 [Lentinula aff. detonsa]|uniref:Uncharacterized protein n=1 Tax=Lentinula aff. detonsa TaxID=2804958 RepID=A0AA38L6U8_9AGAR|nr:hypothetical protein GGU10DRAFT_373128 [Lentinula aff. detonsa]